MWFVLPTNTAIGLRISVVAVTKWLHRGSNTCRVDVLMHSKFFLHMFNLFNFSKLRYFTHRPKPTYTIVGAGILPGVKSFVWLFGYGHISIKSKVKGLEVRCY